MKQVEKFSAGMNVGVTATKSSKRASPEQEGVLTVDVFEVGNEIIVKSVIGNVPIDDIDVSLTKDMVSIKGERKREVEMKKGRYHHQEIYWGRFARSIILPVDVDPDKAKANMKNGILTIRLPKLVRTKK